MAKGKKTGGRDFKKGQSGNPLGPYVIAPDVAEARKFSHQQALRSLTKFLEMSVNELKDALNDTNNSVVDHWVARVCYMGIKYGDTRRLDFMFDRLFGKPKNTTEENTDYQTLKPDEYQHLPQSRILEMRAEAKRYLKEVAGKKDE